MEWLFKIFMLRTRLAHRWENRHRRRITQSVLDTLRKRIEESTRAELPQYLTIYNAGLFTSLLEQDISAYSECLTFARSEWHRQFFARGLAVLLYEGSMDLPQILGKSFRRSLSEFDNGSIWLDKLNPISTRFNKFKMDHAPFLGDVRNMISAHRDHDAIAQLNLLEGLQAIEVYKLAAEFSDPLRQFMGFQTILLSYMHSTPVMVRQIAKAMVANGELPDNAIDGT